MCIRAVQPSDIPVHRSVHGVLPARTANHFHDVDLAAIWPTNIAKVASQRPQRGPYSLASGQGGPDVYSPIGEIKLPLGFDSRGGVVAIALRLTFCRDHQIAISERCVLPLVVLPLVISPTRVANVVIPVATIEHRS